MLSDEAPVDVKNVCPRFFQLETSEKRLFWAYFLQAVAVPESGLQRSNRFRERGIPGIDSVTGLPIWSEGLLQLSYQDTRNHGCGFDWQRDRNLDRDDPDKSIFDPKLNLECGVKILEHQLFGRNPRPLFPSRHYYWSTLTRTTPPRGAYAQVLRELRSAPGFCTR